MKSSVLRKFRFPERQSDIKQVYNMYHLVDLLREREREFKKFKLENQFEVLHRKTERGEYIYAKCKKCSSKLTYQRVNVGKTKHFYGLKVFNPAHQHVIYRNQQFKQLYDFFKNNYKDENMKDSVLIIMAQTKFRDGFSQSEYREVLSKVRKSGPVKPLIKQLQNFREQNFVTIYCSPGPDRKLPDFLFLSSYKMKANYLAYGSFIYIHRIPYIISKAEDIEEWFITVLSGRNKRNQIVFYGVGVTTDHSDRTINEILKEFFIHMGSNICNAIITQNEKNFIDGINLFRKQTGFQGEHFWDLLMELKDDNERKKKIFRRMLRISDKDEYKKLIEQQRKILTGNEALEFEVIQKQSNKYCLTAITPVFIGLGLQCRQLPLILEEVIRQFPFEEPYTHIIFKFFVFLQESVLNDSPTYPHPQYNIYPPLEECFECLSSNVISFLYNQYRKVISLSITNRTYEEQIIKIELETPFSEKVVVQDRFSNELMKCECMLKEKTGIPCNHILKVCLDENINIVTQIDDFWMRNPPSVEEVAEMNRKKNENLKQTDLHQHFD